MANLRILNARTADQWAEIILAKWRENVASILATGLVLFNAREELEPIEWRKLKEKLGFSKSMITELIKAGTDVRFQEFDISNFPASYHLLYRLSTLTDEQFQRGLDSGIIHAGMEQKDIKLLKPPKDKPQPGATLPTGQELVEHRIMELRQQFVRTLRELKPAEQAQYLDLVQFQLNDLRARLEKEAA